mmetsp:Transcript_17091/g.29661  ORF Transcript_17091/g.29661 Transcript_17091/m.29661 type:complete len:162 (+) Transcript_17091:45-530(+)
MAPGHPHIVMGGAGAQTSFLLGWLWQDPKADLAPEAILQRLHPKLRNEIFKRPLLKKSFEDDITAVFKAYEKQASVDEFRELVDGNIAELNKRIEAEGPRHLHQLLKHAQAYSQFHGAAHPLLFAPRAACLPLLAPPSALLPGMSQGCRTRLRRRDGHVFM